MNVTFFGNRVVANVVEVKLKQGGPLFQYDLCPHKRRGDRDTRRAKRCDHGGRNWSATAANQGISRIAQKPPEARKMQGRILPCRFQIEHSLLISDF